MPLEALEIGAFTWSRIRAALRFEIRRCIGRDALLKDWNVRKTCSPQLFHEEANNADFATIVRAIDWGRIRWELEELSGVVLPNPSRSRLSNPVSCGKTRFLPHLPPPRHPADQDNAVVRGDHALPSAVQLAPAHVASDIDDAAARDMCIPNSGLDARLHSRAGGSCDRRPSGG